MNGDILKGPAGFCTYSNFFSRFDGEGHPVELDDKQKALFIMRLKVINPNVVPYYGIEEDLIDSAHIREARIFDDGGMYVRYEVSCRMTDGGWDGPYQLLVLWNRDATLKAYTFIYETGRDSNVAATMYTARDDRSEFTEDVDRAIGFSLAMEDGDSIIVGNDDCNGEFICITSEDGAARLAWQVFGSPYWFNAVKPVSWPDAVKAVRTFQKSGIRGAQGLCEWEVADAYDVNSKMVTVHVPLVLRRDLSRAVRDGDKKKIKAIHDCGITLDGELPEFDVECAFGSEDEILGQLLREKRTMCAGRPQNERMIVQLVENRCKSAA